MAQTSKLESEIEIKSPAREYFKHFLDHTIHFHKVTPHDSRRVHILEGDGKSVGSITSWNYLSDDGKVLSAKAELEALDEENMSLTLRFFQGDIAQLYKYYKLNVQVIENKEKSFVKCCIEYEKVDEGVADSNMYMDAACRLVNWMDSYALQA
ncbi:PREDICTED: kirola-like [Nelumbo nucifera]|uniref:Bet v I/Major latex protein domain-containing protein n=2 Tax=Nelumbo nucifera TaxID=4432 RepID=A0A822YYW6_NELNU|nr:PREDICTED: kirola-like [Nelumbo nucifera]DAD35926.1 TPA_asm: hypothetical protein HUJ06_006566 [Nelumbo nucifera]